MKICLWTDTTWAFGRLANALKAYSRHKISIIKWSTRQHDWDKFDLVHTPVWYAASQFKHLFQTQTPICHAVHGPAELFNTNGLGYHRTITEKEVERCRIPPEVIDIFNRQRAVALPNRELINLLRPQVDCDLCYTPYGVSNEFFQPLQQMPLTVLCPAAPHQFEGKIHGYDVKRWYLAQQIAKRLPNIQFKFIPRRLELNEMPAYYRQGNVLLCVAHSEGGPQAHLEAGAGGVVPLSTRVGHVPEIIIPGYNGEILTGNIVNESVRILSEWNKNGVVLMQSRIIKTLEERRWARVIKYWDDFFDRSV